MVNTLRPAGERKLRVSITELKVGDRIIEDTFNSYGLHILSAGTVLDMDDISKLFRHNIDYVQIDLRQAQQPPAASAPDDWEQVNHAYSSAVEGIKSMFAQAASNDTIDETAVNNSVVPLVSCFKQQKDVVSLLLALNSKDDYTYDHSVQVGMLSYYISLWLGYTEEECLFAGKAGYLHDIGKCKIDNAVLNKPAKLSDEEYMEIKRHTIYGYDLIQESLGDETLARVALEHHERFDGKGYPRGIRADRMLPLSKIVAVADIYSAMTSSRVYQKARDLLTVLKELFRLSFNEIDPGITQVFIRHMMPHFIGKAVLLNDGRTGRIVMTNPTDFFRPLVTIDGKFHDLASNQQLQIDRIINESA